MEPDRHHIAFILKSIACLFCTAVLFSCVNDPDAVKAVRQDKEAPYEWAEDVEMLYSERGVLRALIKAPKVEKYLNNKGRYTLMSKGIHAIFYDSLMTERSSIRAGYAIEYPEKRLVEARNHVRVVNEKGDTLNTEHLYWDRNTQRITTDASVRIITHENEVIYGENGMEADERFTWWRIRRVKESSLIIREGDD